MSEHLMAGLGLILALGITAQLIGWYTRIPSIIILIAAGLLAGPVFGWIHPSELLGDLLTPFISLSVAVILFEGGLILKLDEIKRTAPVVIKLVTLGVLLTWILGSLGGVWILSLEWPLAILLGAILVISGPTVIMPLLRHLRLRGNIAPILKWEGILIDPIGATLALLVFGVIIAGGPQDALTQVVATLATILIVGVVLGSLAAALIIWLLHRYLIPDFLQIPVVLSIVIGGFIVSDILQPDAGLFTAVIAGVILANQKKVSVEHIVDFKEILGLILISLLFIILSATIEIEAILPLLGPILLFSLLLIALARPLSVFIASFRTKLKPKERVLLGTIAPRGIVSASVASVFGLRLSENGIDGAEILLPITFAVILVTVISSSGLATLASRFFGIASPNPQGVIFIGGQNWVRDIASALKDASIPVMIIDHSKSNTAYARRKKIKAHYGDALAPGIIDKLDIREYGNVLAMTSDDNINHLVARHFGREFGTGNTYLLPPAAMPSAKKSRHVKLHLPGRILFSDEASYEYLNDLYLDGVRIKTAELSEKYSYQDFSKENKKALPLFLVTKNEGLTIITPDTPLKDRECCLLIYLAP